ncbi:MAG: hypothetical protein Q9214_000857 [Letrouitia sp. 1 TL-2023]
MVNECSFNPERQDQRQRNYSDLSAEAPTFVPLAQRLILLPRSMPSMEDERSEHMGMSNNLSSARYGQNRLPVYDNSHEYIPPHWIPIYGSGHGMFFDVATSEFRGDGLPRTSFERPFSTMPERPPRRPRLIRPWDHPADQFHIQPAIFLSQPFPAPPNPTHGIQRQYFCACTGNWLPQRHDCPLEQLYDEPPEMDAEPALRSVHDLHEGWVRQRVSIGNTRYLDTDTMVARTDFADERQAMGLMAIDNQDVSAVADVVEGWMSGESDGEVENFGYEQGKEQRVADVPKDEGLRDKPISTRSLERKRARAKKRAEQRASKKAEIENAAEEKNIGQEDPKDEPGDDGPAPDIHVVDHSGTGEEAAEDEKKKGKEEPKDEPGEDGSAPDSHIAVLSSIREETAEEGKETRKDDAGDDGSALDSHIADLPGMGEEAAKETAEEKKEMRQDDSGDGGPAPLTGLEYFDF